MLAKTVSLVPMLICVLLTAAWADPASVTPSKHFLSAQNPVATADQRDLEKLAMRLMESPEVKAGREKATYRWKTAVGKDPTPEQWAMFDAAMEEYAFNFCLKGANSDANYPKVLQLFLPAHEWFGMRVPGSRYAGDNPDNSYRIIPIDGHGRYAITGQRFNNPPSDVTYTLVGDYSTSKTLASLEGRDLQVAKDGTYTITIDGEPANGRPNHIQSKPNAVFLYIRDSRGDWKQLPNALTVKRLDRPSAPPMTEKQLAERTADILVDEMPLTYWWLRQNSEHGPNVLATPDRPLMSGGLASQVSSHGVLHLNDDEAIIVSTNAAGAAFRNIVLQDYWFRTLDYPHHTSSMNNTQGIANADGTYTYVVSVRDPGVYNWLDTGGLHDVRVVMRWQGLPRTKSADDPTVRVQVTKLKDLAALLPQGTKTVTPEERKQQLAERLESFQLRLIDR